MNKPSLFKYVITFILAVCLLNSDYVLPSKQAKAADFVTLAYEFTTDGNLEGWMSSGWGLDSYNVSGGSLNLVTNLDPNPAWFAPWPLNLHTDIANEIVIRMKTDKGSNLRVFFDSDLNPGLNVNKMAEISINADGQYHEYRIPIGSNTLWTGTIKQLRFDLMPDYAAVPLDWSEVNSANVSFDYVHFVKSIPEPTALEYEFNTDGNLEGWIPNGWGLDSYNVSGGTLHILTNETINPAWFAPWPLNVDTSSTEEIVIRMKTDKGSNLRVFYDTDLSPGLNGYKLEDIAINADGEFHEYRIAFGANANWTGTIKQMRFDLMPDYGTVPIDWSEVYNANISIDYVHFIQKPPATAYEFYADPEGSGTECSEINPCSLTGARNKVRTVNFNMNNDITVYLLDGTYSLSSSFELNMFDSGSNGYNVIYKAAPGANPILSGGRAITGWELYDSVNEIYRAPAPANFSTRQLYVDGVRATRAMGETSPEGWENVQSYGYSSGANSAAAHTEFVQIDLAAAQLISAVKLYPRNDTQTAGGGSPGFPVDFTLEGSTDGINYTDLTTVANQANPQGIAQEYTFSPANVRYVKLNATKLGAPAGDESGVYRLQLAEMEVRGNTAANLAIHKEVSASSSSLDNLFWGKDKLTDGITSAAVAYVMPNTDMADWKNISDIEVAIMRNWQIDRALIASIDGSNVTMQRNAAAQNEKPTWIENAYELLDQPGEWYMDNTGDVDEEYGLRYVYYKPLENQDPSTAEIIAPAVESLIIGTGTLDLPIHHIVIEGLQFSYSTWTFPSSVYGYPSVQAGIYTIGPSNRKPPSAVSFTYANSIAISRNIFTHLGGSGLDISLGSHDNAVEGNLFEDIASTGVWIGSNDDHHMFNTGDARYVMKDNTVKNNYITNIGVEYLDAVAIFAGYTEHTVIEHNEIFNVPYTGISVGWGWGTLDYPGDPTVAKENEIKNNLVHHVMRALHDGGAIYTQSAQPDSIISGNWVHHTYDPLDSQGYKNEGIYLDNGTQYYTVQDNVVQVTPNWLFMNDNQNNTAHSNYADTANYRVSRNTNVVNATVVTDENWPPAAISIMDNAGLESEYESIKLKSAGGTVKAFERRYIQQSDSHALSFGLEPEIVSFQIAGQVGESRINKQAHTVHVFMPTGTNITALTPEILLLDGYTIDPLSGQARDFTNSVSYDVYTPENTVIPWTVHVTVLDDLTAGPTDTVFVPLNPYLLDVSNWTGDITPDDGSITYGAGTIATYQGQKFEDELLEFDMELPLTGSDWMGFNLRDKYPNTPIFNGNTGYHFVVKQDVWELQKWVKGAREMLIGQFEMYTPRWGTLANTQFHSNTKHRVQAGAINVPEGVRLVLYIDGVRIFDVVDTVDPISEPGYLTIYPMSGSIKISPIELPEEEEITPAAMRGKVEAFVQASKLNRTFAADLNYRLSIVQILLDQNAKAVAVSYMNDFILHINDPAVRQQKLITADAAGILEADGNALISTWT